MLNLVKETLAKAWPFVLILALCVYCILLIAQRRDLKQENKKIKQTYTSKINELKTVELKKLQTLQYTVDSLRITNLVLESENEHLTDLSNQIIKSYDKKINNLNALPDDSLAGLFSKYLSR